MKTCVTIFSQSGICTYESWYFNLLDLNYGPQNTQPDAASCRKSCKSVNGSNYFAYNTNNERCWCKSKRSNNLGNCHLSPFLSFIIEGILV